MMVVLQSPLKWVLILHSQRYSSVPPLMLFLLLLRFWGYEGFGEFEVTGGGYVEFE